MRHLNLMHKLALEMEISSPGGIGTYRVHHQALLWSLSGSIGAQLGRLR